MEKAEGDEEEEEEQGPQPAKQSRLRWLCGSLHDWLRAWLISMRDPVLYTVRSGEELGGGWSGDDPENEAKLNELSNSLRRASMRHRRQRITPREHA